MLASEGGLKHMDSAVIIRDVVTKLNNRQNESQSYLHLSIPPILSEFRWRDSHFRNLIKKFFASALKNSHPKRPIRIAVNELKGKADLEQFFSISPSRWFRMSMECCANADFAAIAQNILKDLGYRCSEWVGIENSESQLGDFRYGTEDHPAIILFIQNRGTRRNCDFLIPVMD
jgi:hypothetical protein